MSKSMDFTISYLDKIEHKNDNLYEVESEPFFSSFMGKRRNCVIKAPFGKIKFNYIFSKNADFNCFQSFVLKQDEIDTDIDSVLNDVAYRTLNDRKFKAPSKRFVDSMTEGDLITITIGNFIIENNVTINNGKVYQESRIFLPTKMERTPGGMHE